MHKKTGKIFATIIAFLFSASLLLPFEALARGGTGSSSGGFRGGGSSSSSSSRSTFSSGSGWGGRSSSNFSSPNPSRPSTPSFPSTPARPSYPSAPSAPSTPSKPFYSTPSRQDPPPPPVEPSKKFFSAPESSPSAPKTPRTTIDTQGQQALKGKASREAFDAANRPATKVSPSVTAPAYDWRARGVDTKDKQIQTLSRKLDYTRLENRNLREQKYFNNYAGRSTPCCYSDPFGNVFFWMWLMDRPHHDRDTWVYHHRDSMDPGRYAELKRQDPDLERRIAELERQGLKRDPGYVPQELADDPDVMYNEDYVRAMHQEANKSSFPWFLVIVGMLLVIAGVVVFFRWRVVKA